MIKKQIQAGTFLALLTSGQPIEHQMVQYDFGRLLFDVLICILPKWEEEVNDSLSLSFYN